MGDFRSGETSRSNFTMLGDVLMRFQQIQIVVAIYCTASFLTGCSPKSSSDSLGGDGASSTTSSNGDCTSGASLVQNSEEGTIQFRLSDSTDPCSVDGYVVGSSESSGVTRNEDGTYVVTGVGEGEQDIILTGASSSKTTSGESTTPNDIGGSNLQSLAIDTGIRVNNLTSSSQIQNFRLAKFGKMTGRVFLNGASDHTGIDVYIPGTSYIAKTDKDGNYKLENLPPGIHSLRFEFPQYGFAVLPDLTVRSEEITQVPDSRLYTGAGEGRILILDANLTPITLQNITVSSRVVRFALQVQGTPRLMKISEDGNFANIAWQPFKSEGHYTFKALDQNSGGRETRRLSVRTLDGNTEGDLEISLVVELFSEIRGKEVFTVDNLDENEETSLQIRIKSILAPNVKEMRVSTREDFLGANWLPAEATKFHSVNEEGDYPVFVQFRTNDLVATDIYSAVARVKIFPVGSVSFTVSISNNSIDVDPTFSLSNIVSPRRTGDVKLRFFADQDQEIIAEKNYATSFDIDTVEVNNVCGMKTLTARLVYRKSVNGISKDFISDAVVKDASYPCFNTIPRIPGDRIDQSNVKIGDGKIFLWSGTIAGVNTQSSRGYLYDTTTGRYEALTTTNQPLPRTGAKVWYQAGEFIVLGGKSGSTDLYDGGIYNTANKTWRKIPVPSPQTTLTAQTTQCGDTIDDQFSGEQYMHLVGNYLLMWGDRANGEADCDGDPAVGYLFNIQTDSTWSAMDNEDFPKTPCNLDKKMDASVAVVGSKLFVWSGLECEDLEAVNTGGSLFDPVSNSWEEIATANAPTNRFDYITVWNGTDLLVWGGKTLDSNGEFVYEGMEIGGIFNPASNSWTTTSAAPYALNMVEYHRNFFSKTRVHTTSVNNKFAIFAGHIQTNKNWGGLIYNKITNTWSVMPSERQPDFKGFVKDFIDDDHLNPDVNNFDESVEKNGKIVLWTRAASPNSLSPDFIHGSVFDLNTEVWKPLPTVDRSFTALEASPYLRNDPILGFISETDVVFFGGTKPYDIIVPRSEQALNDGVIIKIP